MKMSFRGVSCLMTGAAFVMFAFLSPNCQPTGGVNGGDGGSDDSGGNNGSGGNTSNGGNTNNGGSNSGNGGSQSNGGSSSSNGGSASKGGSNSSNGGSQSNGGSSSSNGGSSSSNGGSSSSNGGSTPSNGGSTPSNGGTVTSNGGSTATSTSSTPTGTTVAFASGKATGAMTGYGWVSLGSADSLSDPLCGTAPFTSATTCAATTWSTKDGLCMSGSVPQLAATNPDYSGNWGVQVGVNSTDPAGSGLGQSFSSIAITVSGSPTSGLRAMVHRKGDSVGAGYCAAMTSGTAIPFTSFNTKCYDTPPDGTALTAADVANIDQVGVQVSSSGTAAITVAKLCMMGITFAK